MTELLSGSLQDNVAVLAVFSDTGAPVVRASVNVALFTSRVYRDIISRAYAFLDAHKVPPKEHIYDELEDLVQKGDEHGELLGGVLKELHSLWTDKSRGFREDYVRGALEHFVRQQSLKVGIVQAHAAILTGDLEGAEAELTKAMRARTASFTPGITLLDTVKLLSSPDAFRDTLSLGIGALDSRHLGPAKQELHLFIAPPKAGKCIHGDTLVLLPDGRRKRIEDVVRDKDKRVLALDEATGKTVEVTVSEHWDNGKKNCVRVTTKLGRQITTTRKHLYLTEKGWVPVEKLVAGSDRIAVPTHLPGLGKKEEDPRKLRLLGYLLADGCLLDKWCPSFTKFPGNTEIIEDFKRCVAVFGDTVSSGDGGTVHYIVGEGKTKSWLKELGLLGKHSRDKVIPGFVFSLRDDLIAEFLKGLLSCDCGLWGPLEYTSASAAMAEQVHHLLLRLGVTSRCSQFTARLDGKLIPGYGRTGIRSLSNLRKFSSVIGPLVGKKEQKLQALLLQRSRGAKAEALRRNYGTRDLSNHYTFDVVKTIEAAGRHHTFDLSVPRQHNFLAGDIVVHNSWWLTHCTKRAIQVQKWRGVYITLELSERLVGRRELQALFHLKTRTNKVVVRPKFVFDDETSKLISIDMTEAPHIASIESYKDVGKYAKEIDKLRLDSRLLIKGFPTGSLTVPGIEAYLNLLDSVHKFVPDFVCLDYADLMKLDANNYRHSLGELYKDLRGLAVARNFALITASQSNRSGANARLVRATDVAEDFSKIGTADCVITYSATAQESRRGLARLHVAAGRVEEDKFTVVVAQSYASGQFALESFGMMKEYWTFLPKDDEAEEGNGD